MIRPLPTTHRAILTALAEKGPAGANELGCPNNRRQMMVRLVDDGYIVRSHRVARGKQTAWIYELTAEGRAALAAEVQRLEEEKARLAKASSRFTATTPPMRPIRPRTEHAHHWLIGNDLAQSATCQTCGAVKQFRLTFGRELAPVGTERVTPSERFAARVG